MLSRTHTYTHTHVCEIRIVADPAKKENKNKVQNGFMIKQIPNLKSK